MKKENVILDYNEMIKEAWTYEKLTNKEKENWEKILLSEQTNNALKGTYKQRWNILNAIYGAFLNALDYKPTNWRE